MDRLTRARLAAVVLIVLLVTPVAVQGLTYQDEVDRGIGTDFGGREDVLFVTTQGTETLNGAKAQAIAIDTATGEVLWRHTPLERYFDIDPLDEDTVLFLGAEGPHGANMHAYVVNWRTGETLLRFEVPADTHDVDYLGGDEYVVADKADNRLYVYDVSNESVTWEYDFREHFSPDAGIPGDYTHLNDVDPVDNGSKFLVSPRNFDRVFLLNRSTQEVEWTLGAEDDFDVLYEQHNPVLLTADPPTVLVADSENDRVVEYRRTETGDWELVWAYRGSMRWPRDADRLQNGNTLIVDSSGGRVLEVTPSRGVVWELSVTKAPYDAELLSLGEEPAGPSMTEFTDQFDDPAASSRSEGALVSRLNYLVSLSQWVVPWQVTATQLGLLGVAVLVGLLWTGTETARAFGRRETGRDLTPAWLPAALGVGALGVGTVLLAAPGVDRYAEPFWRGLGTVTVVMGVLSIGGATLWGPAEEGARTRLPAWTSSTLAGLAVVGALLGVLLTPLNAFYLSAGVLFTHEAVRHVPRGWRTARPTLYALAVSAVRFGSLVPALVLLYITPGTSQELLYLGLSCLVVVNALSLRGGFVGTRVARRVPRSVTGGARLLLLALVVLVGVGFVVQALGPTTLNGAYAGLAALAFVVAGAVLSS
jgi:outer membrane protein assembly factor BamB